jgi:hypothetical protein
VREKAATQTAAADSQEFASPNARAGINPPSYWLERGKPQRQGSLVWIRWMEGLLHYRSGQTEASAGETSETGPRRK